MSISFYKLLRPIIFCFTPEFCHNLAIFLLRHNLIAPQKVRHEKPINFFGMVAKNKIGLAAGFDKNGEALKNLSKMGFGFIEVGTATPLPQSGNSKPRLFRLAKHKSIVNCFGFNNKGADCFAANLAKFYPHKPANIMIGANIGKNKNTADISADYVIMLQKVYQFCDYITINISSPNTAGLRDIQNEENLEILLNNINIARHDLIRKHKQNKPILLKLSPDIEKSQMVYITNLIGKYGIDGVILTNTTVQKQFGSLPQINLQGGVSGSLLRQKSLQILKDFYEISQGKIPIISAGGIFTPEDVKERILHGAFAVQVYSSLIYEGFGLVKKLTEEC